MQFKDKLTGDASDNILMGGKGNDTLDGDGGTDNLFGGAGNDKLDGGKGSDAFYGGAGNDTYFVDDIRDRAFEEQDGGKDTVVATSDHVMSDNIEKLVFRGGAALNGFGNEDKNKIVGNRGDNTLQGLGGNDVIDGRAGDDYLVGGAGNDKLNGGAGNDVLTGGAGKDVFRFTKSFGNDIITDFQIGEDLIRFSAGNSEAKTFTQFIGAARDTASGVEYDLAGDGSNVLVLSGLTLASLSETDFDFV